MFIVPCPVGAGGAVGPGVGVSPGEGVGPVSPQSASAGVPSIRCPLVKVRKDCPLDVKNERTLEESSSLGATALTFTVTPADICAAVAVTVIVSPLAPDLGLTKQLV